MITGSKDGQIVLWTIGDDGNNTNTSPEVLRLVEEVHLNQPISKVKWLSPTQVVVATKRGQLMVHSFEKAENPFNQSFIYQTDSAIMDI